MSKFASPFRRVHHRPLYFMIKPDADIAESIWRNPRASKRRPPNLFHCTVLGLFDRALFPPEALGRLLEIMEGFEAPPFRVVFDVIDERRVVALRGSERMFGAERFQKRLEDFLRKNGFPFIGERPDIHLTMAYERDGLGAEPIIPLSWTVTELLLIESVVGKSRHIIRGRWPLITPRPGCFEFGK